jgi:hypothetical protein
MLNIYRLKQTSTGFLLCRRPQSHVTEPKPKEESNDTAYLSSDQRIRPYMLRSRGQDQPTRFLAATCHSKILV